MNRATIIALVGIDGAGKTSILEALKLRPEFRDVLFVKKVHRDAVTSVAKAFPNIERSEHAYLFGDFASAIRWAHAFDFLRFYEEEVLPHLAGRALVVSDRWSVCSVAFSATIPTLNLEIRDLLRCVLPADKLVYIDIEPQESIRRITRFRTLHGDESFPCLEAFRTGYEQILPSEPSEIVRIKSVSFDATLECVASIIRATKACPKD